MPITFSWKDVNDTVETIVHELRTRYPGSSLSMVRYTGLRNIYAIPRGGAVPGALLSQRLNVPLIDLQGEIDSTTLVVDDIIDTGDTMVKHLRKPVWGVVALVAKPSGIARLRDLPPETLSQWIVRRHIKQDTWLEFPWEQLPSGETETVHENITRVLEFIGEDITREGLVETPTRIVRMLEKGFYGYQTPQPKLKTFSSGSESMVVKTGIRAYSWCEHHAVPMILNFSFAYIPKGKVVGISKIVRLIHWACARLVIQEDLTERIVDAFQKEVEPQGTACIIQGLHLCELMRGVKTQNVTVTSALRGVFKTQPETREEFLQIIKMKNPFAF